MTGSWLDGFFGTSTAGGGLVATGNSLAVNPDGITIGVVGGKVALDATLASQVQNLSTVNVKAAPYNAKGDGSTDDISAINAAMAAVGLAGGGEVFFPKGIYIVSDQVQCLYDNVTLRGVKGSIIKAKSGANFVVVLRADSRTNIHWIDLEIDANQAGRSSVATTALDGCGFNGCTDCDGTGLVVRNTYGPSAACYSIDSASLRCWFYSSKAINGGVASHASDGFFISGTSCGTQSCYSESCLDTGAVIEAGNDCWHFNFRSKNCGAHGAITNTSNSDIQNNGFIGGSGDGWSATVTGGIEVGSLAGSGNVLNTTIMGVTLSNPAALSTTAVFLRKTGTGNVKGLKFIGNTIDGALTQALNVSSGSTDLHFSGNTFRATQYAMLFQSAVTNVSILGNKIYPHTGGYGGIGLNANCTDFEIHDNYIDCANGTGTAASYGVFYDATCLRIRHSLSNKIVNAGILAINDPGPVVDYVFVDLTTAQTAIGGAKTFSNAMTLGSTFLATGPAAVGAGALPSAGFRSYAASNTSAFSAKLTSSGQTGYILNTGVEGFLDYSDNTTNGVRLSAYSGGAGVRIGVNSNAAYGSSTFTEVARFGPLNGGTGIFALANGTAPTSTPSGAGIQYVVGGALLYIGTSGTVTTLAPA